MIFSIKKILKQLELYVHSAEQSSKTLLTNHNIQCSLLQANQKQCNPDDYKIDIENIVLGEILKKSDMMNVGIYTLEGETMYSSTNVYFNKKNVLKELWYQKVQNTLGEMIWIDTYKDNLNHDVISASRKFMH